MNYSFWFCENSNIFYTFYHSDTSRKYTCTVYFLLFIDSLTRYMHWCHILLCVCRKKKKSDGRGMEFAFVIRLKLFHSEDVSCIFKSSQRISPRFDQLSLSIQYFFVEHFFQCWRCRYGYLFGNGEGQETGQGRRDSAFQRSDGRWSHKRPAPRGSEKTSARSGAMHWFRGRKSVW